MPNRKVNTGGMKRPASSTDLAASGGGGSGGAPSSSGLTTPAPPAQRRRLIGGGGAGGAQSFSVESLPGAVSAALTATLRTAPTHSSLISVSPSQSAVRRIVQQQRPSDNARMGQSPLALTLPSIARREAASVSPVMSVHATVSLASLYNSQPLPVEGAPSALTCRTSGRVGEANGRLATSSGASQSFADRSATLGSSPAFVSASAAVVQRGGSYDYRPGGGNSVGRQSPMGNARARGGASTTTIIVEDSSNSGKLRTDNFNNTLDLFVAAPYGTFSQSVANRRLLAEMKQLEESPLAGCQASPREESILQWTAAIDGPADTVYEGGTFFVELTFTDNYPFEAPKIVFLTRIYHCNINSQGKVCMDPISRGWTSCMTISTVLQSLISLLYACNPKDALVPYIAEQFMKSPDEYDKMARIWTQRYAQ